MHVNKYFDAYICLLWKILNVIVVCYKLVSKLKLLIIVRAKASRGTGRGMYEQGREKEGMRG